MPIFSISHSDNVLSSI